MSLQVGELVAILGLDDTPLRSGLDQSMARMSADVESGAKATGDQAGRRLGDSLAEGVEGTDVDIDQVLPDDSSLDMVGAAKGALLGGALFAGISTAMSRDADADVMVASLGLTGEAAEEAGRVAGSIYSDGFGESAGQVNDAVASVISTLSDLGVQGEANIERVSTKALNLSKAFGVDVSESVMRASQLVREGLAVDADHAFDLMTSSMQRVPVAMRAELFPVLDEYTKDFAALGFTGEQAMGMLVDAAAGGSFELDKTADAIKEMGIRVSELEGTAGPELERLGMDATDMADRFLAGGATAQGALADIVDGLLSLEAPSQQAQAAVAIFGTPIEDLAKGNIPGFLTALDEMGAGMEGVAGSAEALGEGINDNAQASVTELARSLETAALPALSATVAVVEPLLSALTAVPAPVLQLVAALGLLKAAWGPLSDMAGAARGLPDMFDRAAMSADRLAGRVDKVNWTDSASSARKYGEAIGMVAGAIGLIQDLGNPGAQGLKEYEEGWEGVRQRMIDTGDAAEGLAGDLEAGFAQDPTGPLVEGLREAGLTVEDYAQALLGTEDEARAFADRLGEGAQAAGYAADEVDHFETMLLQNRDSALEAAAGLGDYNAVVGEGEAATDGYADAAGSAADRADELADSVATLKSTIEDLIGAKLDLSDATLDVEDGYADLITTLAENGGALDYNTEAGRTNLGAINDQVRGVLELAQAMADETGDVSAATGVLGTHRDRLIDVMTQTGLTRDAAEDYLDALGLIPSTIDTAVRIDTSGASASLAALLRQTYDLQAEIGGSLAGDQSRIPDHYRAPAPAARPEGDRSGGRMGSRRDEVRVQIGAEDVVAQVTRRQVRDARGAAW